MDYLELQSIRSEKVHRIPAFRIVRKIAGTIEDLCAEALRQIACPINLLTRIGVEGDVMQPYLVNLEWMLGKLRLCFPEIQHRAIPMVDRQPIALPIRIPDLIPNLIAEELQERLEELHSVSEIADRDTNVADCSK